MSTSTSGIQVTLVLRAPGAKATADAHDSQTMGAPALPLGAPPAAAPGSSAGSAPKPPQASPMGAPPAAGSAPKPPQASPAAQGTASPKPIADAHAAAAAVKQAPVTAARGPELVTLAQLRAVMTALHAAKANLYLGPLNQAMTEFKIDNRLRICAFLGQVAEESGQLAWFQEFASGREYDITVNPRLAKGLGNLTPGDGPRYKGRGPIQLTGRSNYIACGRALGIDLVDTPDLAIQPSIAFRTAGWFWSTHGLNQLADQQDYRGITHRINGGYNGYAARLAFYEKALTVFPATPLHA